MRNKNLLRLIYTSRAGVRFDDESLQTLLERARSNNYHSGITGVLSFGNGFFLQVLEGPEDQLIPLYARILADTRHRDCVILDVHLAEQRLFANWSMGYVSDIRKIGGHYNEMLDYRTVREDRKGTLSLLDELLEIVRE